MLACSFGVRKLGAIVVAEESADSFWDLDSFAFSCLRVSYSLSLATCHVIGLSLRHFVVTS